ncbi:hypothetical protein RRG08_042656 [Elysia crispata]|uniref:Uncharacterized protein n=1 Tax=Elysia crispata TaxID=231223 RepID=A0AAE1CK13_9GAST|nr:hypothetical protein RRG08_042656 [Elysia crispata]
MPLLLLGVGDSKVLTCREKMIKTEGKGAGRAANARGDHDTGSESQSGGNLGNGRLTTEHVLSSCKIALSPGRYTWRHNRVLQELAAIISTAKGKTTLPKTNTLIFTMEEGANFLTTADYGGANSSIRKQNRRGPRLQYLKLTKELEDAGYKAVPMLDEVGARGFIGSSVYDLLTKLSIRGNKRTKALKLLAEIENRSRWIWSRRNENFLHKD